ncbi:MAG TPA: hypothetical protein DC054_19390 [Blastocatellia bacterium]|nr:hypothetical protein [Blastocatellia bacterium]
MSDSILDADLNELLVKGYAELETALQHEANAEKQLAFCQSKVARLTQKIIQLSIASDDQRFASAVKETGLTDAIRMVLKAAEGNPFTAVQIRQRLEQIGFDISTYQNFLATLYLTLHRLEKQNEVIEVKAADGKKGYSWLGAQIFTSGLSDNVRKAMAEGIKPPSFQKRFMEGPKRSLRFPSPEKKKD